ncbi:MAG TPA: hypothetical protein VFR37_21010, partial [Longimicrobium sp.]|nr:hypothetical protein [Longimicrobium sp.]
MFVRIIYLREKSSVGGTTPEWCAGRETVAFPRPGGGWMQTGMDGNAAGAKPLAAGAGGAQAGREP